LARKKYILTKSEKRDVAAQNPDVVATIRAAVEAHQAEMIPGTPQ